MNNDTPILTAREMQVLKLVRDGLENKEIARLLNIKSVTVEFHLGNLFKKLDVSSRTAAVVLAEKLGILET